jgi:small subunit ribosomal protein S20
MANTKSAAKRARQTVRRTSRNRKVKATIKGELKGIRAAIAGGKKAEATKLLGEVSSVLDRAAKTGRVHKNKVNRHKSDLASQIAALK